mmetsp:Transcript_79179/g.181273  ORF Transcript_79179/g.181273 Transcript_79179/m.181273 type:complete len:81 (-) Transcript_79179:33-275(-)
MSSTSKGTPRSLGAVGASVFASEHHMIFGKSSNFEPSGGLSPGVPEATSLARQARNHHQSGTTAVYATLKVCERFLFGEI